MSCPSKVGRLVGSPVLPFIDQGGSRGYRWEKEENTKSIEGPSKDPGLPFFPRLPCITWQTMSGVARLLIFVGHALASFSKWVRPILRRRTVRRAGEPSCDPSGSNRGSDNTPVTVDEVIPILGHSGCRMPVLVSSPED